AGIGNVTHRPDVDGIYRRIHPFILFDGRLLPSLSVAPLMDVAAPAVLRDGEIRIGGLRLPVDKEGKMWVNFKGPFDGYRHYSAVDVIQSAILVAEGRPPLVPAEVFKDAYVFVAYTAPGLFDLKPTPVSALSPGVGVHMVVLDNLLNRDFQRPAPFSWVALLAAAGTFLVVAAVILIPAVWLVMVAVTGVFGLIFIGALFSFGQGFGMNLTALGLTALLGLISASMYRYQVEGKNRRFIHKAFSHYLSPKMVSQLLTDPERLVLGGENKELTLFFSDLVGFTTLSERLDAQDLVAVLNDYTSFMADTIAKYEGTLDKYIGDAVMAFWGAPVDQPDQSSKAVLAALECRERLAEFSRELARTRGDIAIDMRIGIDRGQCVVGNMGSARRFDYTAIGNPVNQAARLEGINKVYRTHILMGEAVREVCKDVVFSRVIDYLRVKGREIPVRVYEVMARSGEESDAQRWLKQRYEAAFAAYGRRDWVDAMLILEEILAGEDDDGPANTLLCRVRKYQVDPPPPDWDGAFTHTSK
ncbi:MAG: adenylate/guanylate cyclase domain-containing protein, partial [Gammaproteobacteria bacterium]|nr:adenylate/guanylate cyclase domain-containing protein [Gammaproteobacteria bacterium]